MSKIHLELTEEQFGELIRGLMTYGLNARMDGFNEEADTAYELGQELFKQYDNQD